MPVPNKSTQPLDAGKRPSARPAARSKPHARADRGSPWAWVIVIALALAATGWWLAADQDDDNGYRAAPATPSTEPPHAQPVH